MHAPAAWFGLCAALFTSSCLAQSSMFNPTSTGGGSPTPSGVASFGFDQSRAVSFAGSPAPQQAVFSDGLAFQIQAQQPLQMNVGIQRGLNRQTLPLGIPSLNTFAYIVNTSTPNQVLNAQIDVPVSIDELNAIVPSQPVMGSNIRGAVLMVARRPLNGGGIMFERIPNQPMPFVPLIQGLNPIKSLAATGLVTVDGEYVILVGNPDDDSIFDTVQERDQVKQAVAQMSGGERRAAPGALFIFVLFSSLSVFWW